MLKSSKPPIFRKEKPLVKKQLNIWNYKDLKKISFKINDIEILKRVFKNIHGKSITLIYDSDCGFCHQIVRIIKRLDIFNRITMQITPIPCLKDNYAYIINDENSKINNEESKLSKNNFR